MACNFDSDSKLAQLFAKTDIIVWDEASMVNLTYIKIYSFYFKAHKWIIKGKKALFTSSHILYFILAVDKRLRDIRGGMLHFIFTSSTIF